MSEINKRQCATPIQQSLLAHSQRPVLPNEVQSKLLLGPMRVRKAIHNGYQLPSSKPKSIVVTPAQPSTPAESVAQKRKTMITDYFQPAGQSC